MPGSSVVSNQDRFWFIGKCLVIPSIPHIWEALFYLAHDTLSHFGADRLYTSLRDSYYWPNMWKHLDEAYVPACLDCQCNKSQTNKPFGPLHLLPIPEQCGDLFTIDFIGPLPPDNGYNPIIMFTNCLNSDIQITPSTINLSAEKLADLFFDKWYCENGLPLEIISNRDKLFLLKFWSHLHKLTGVKIKMSTAYHSKTDGMRECSNKMVIQVIWFHVEWNQQGWVWALLRVRFNIMNTMNKSTGFSPFQLHMGCTPHIIPPLLANMPTDSADISPPAITARMIIKRLQHDVLEAQDNMIEAKVSQAQQVNKHWLLNFPFVVGQCVHLSILHHQQDYKLKDEKCVVKFMPWFNGPYEILTPHDLSCEFSCENVAADNIVY